MKGMLVAWLIYLKKSFQRFIYLILLLLFLKIFYGTRVLTSENGRGEVRKQAGISGTQSTVNLVESSTVMAMLPAGPADLPLNVAK